MLVGHAHAGGMGGKKECRSLAHTYLLLSKTTESTSSRATDFLGMTVISCADSFVINIASQQKRARFSVKKRSTIHHSKVPFLDC